MDLNMGPFDIQYNLHLGEHLQLNTTICTLKVVWNSCRSYILKAYYPPKPHHWTGALRADFYKPGTLTKYKIMRIYSVPPVSFYAPSYKF